MFMQSMSVTFFLWRSCWADCAVTEPYVMAVSSVLQAFTAHIQKMSSVTLPPLTFSIAACLHLDVMSQ